MMELLEIVVEKQILSEFELAAEAKRLREPLGNDRCTRLTVYKVPWTNAQVWIFDVLDNSGTSIAKINQDIKW